jgi:hypothetical protein
VAIATRVLDDHLNMILIIVEYVRRWRVGAVNFNTGAVNFNTGAVNFNTGAVNSVNTGTINFTGAPRRYGRFYNLPSGVSAFYFGFWCLGPATGPGMSKQRSAGQPVVWCS